MSIKYALIFIFAIFISSLCEAKIVFMGMRGSSNNQTITLTGDVTGSGIGSIITTIATSSVTLGTDTAGVLPTTQGGWGTTTPNLALVEQVGGTCTGMTADNATIGGTNSTATLRTLIVTETLESGSQWSTSGSSSVTTGTNQNQTHNVSGTGQFVVKGSGTTNIETTLYANSPLQFLLPSNGTGSTYGGTTTVAVVGAYVIPSNTLGTNSTLRIWTAVTNGSTTAGAVTWTLKLHNSLTNGTTTIRTYNPNTLTFVYEDNFVFRGSSTQCIVYTGGGGGLGGSSGAFSPLEVNVAATNTFSLSCTHSASASVGTSTLEYCLGEILKR